MQWGQVIRPMPLIIYSYCSRHAAPEPQRLCFTLYLCLPSATADELAPAPVIYMEPHKLIKQEVKPIYCYILMHNQFRLSTGSNCALSRHSTVTGRYNSRGLHARSDSQDIEASVIADQVTVRLVVENTT